MSPMAVSMTVAAVTTPLWPMSRPADRLAVVPAFTPPDWAMSRPAVRVVFPVAVLVPVWLMSPEVAVSVTVAALTEPFWLIVAPALRFARVLAITLPVRVSVPAEASSVTLAPPVTVPPCASTVPAALVALPPRAVTETTPRFDATDPARTVPPRLAMLAESSVIVVAVVVDRVWIVPAACAMP